MKAIIDTSVFISYLLTARGVTTWLLHDWRQREFSIVISKAILTELLDVSSRENTKQKINDSREIGST